MLACFCADRECRLYGCKLRKEQAAYPRWPDHDQTLKPAPVQGCICPLTSEITCENEMCPRKSSLPRTALGEKE